MYVHAQAPVRIGIAGGGTDLPAWTKERVGYCLSLAINTYTHTVAIMRPDKKVVASYRQLDHAACATEIANGLIRESALMHGWEDSFEVHTLSEISSLGSGLGVSSSIAVALAAVFARMTVLQSGCAAEPKWMDGGEPAFKQGVATDAWTVEIEKLRRPIGRQDHMAAAWGGLRLYRFEGDNAMVERTFSEEDARWIAEHLCLMQLSEGHDSRAILQNVKSADQIEAAYDAVDIALKAIEKRSPVMLGEALLLGQRSKEQIPGATVATWIPGTRFWPESIEGIYGGKIAGAGGGGHAVIACEPSMVEWIRREQRQSARSVLPDFHGVRSEGWL